MPISHAHLRSFHAVATHGSFTRAAEMLNITQPTLSGQVKDLEIRYGTKLLVRLGRRIELTDIGRSAFNITRLLFRPFSILLGKGGIVIPGGPGCLALLNGTNG